MVANSRKITTTQPARWRFSSLGSAVHSRKAETSFAIWSTVALGAPSRIGDLAVAGQRRRHREVQIGEIGIVIQALGGLGGREMLEQFGRLLLVAGEQRIDVRRAAFARLGHQRQVGRHRIAVGGARRGLIGVRVREAVGRGGLAGRRLAGVGVDRRDFDLPEIAGAANALIWPRYSRAPAGRGTTPG